MSKKSGVVILVLALAILSFQFASADVFLLTQPENNYNLGDVFAVTLGSDGAEGWASVNLICNDQSKMLYFHYITDSSTSNINAPLTKDFLRGMIGNCHLQIGFNGKTKDSFSFIISDKIDISISFNGQNFNPGEGIIFEGEVSKPDQMLVDGFVTLKFGAIGLEIIVPVIEDKFSGNLTIPENVAAGNYGAFVYVNEKDSLGEITNHGESEGVTITVLQKPTKLTLDYDNNIPPGTDFSFRSILYDQTNMIISNKSVAYRLSDSNGEEVFNKLGNTEETVYVHIEKNAPFGYWSLSSDSEGILSNAQIYVEKNMEATFIMVNGTLVVRNVGNVLYNKTIEVKIGNETKIKSIILDVGRSIEFPLSAPDGEYDVGVSDGERAELFKEVSLTGGVISIDGVKKYPLNFFNRSWIAWTFIILILGLFIFVASRKVVNKNVFLSSKDTPKYNSSNEDLNKKGGVVRITPTGENKAPVIEPDTGIASHSTVIDGIKQNASIIAIKLKNYQDLKNNQIIANDLFKGVIKEITDSQGKVYRTADFIVGIFAPVITRKSDNNLVAIKTAQNITRILKEYNHKFKQRIDFGIGINTGDIIAKKDAGKLLFTPLGTTLVNAKKVAEIAMNNALLSEDVHKKVMSQVKSIANNETNGVKTYSITDIVDRQQNSKFIESFLQRNQEYKTLRDYRSSKFDQPNNKPSFNNKIDDVKN